MFPGGKGGWCIRLTTLPPSFAVVMKSGNLNFLEPSGPVEACNRTALPLPFLPIIWKILMFAAFGVESNPESISIEGITYTLRTGVYRFSNHVGTTSKF